MLIGAIEPDPLDALDPLDVPLPPLLELVAASNMRLPAEEAEDVVLLPEVPLCAFIEQLPAWAVFNTFIK